MDTPDPRRNDHRQRTTGLALVATLLVACTTNPPPTSTAALSIAPTATAAESALPSMPTASPSVNPSLPPTSWDQVFTLERGGLSDLIAWRDGVVATGCIADPVGDCGQRIVVLSSDGVTWEVVEVDTPGNLSFGSVHRVGKRLFGLSYANTRKYAGAVVLTSLDGRSWTRLRTASFGARSIRDIIQTPRGTFAIGYNAPPDSDNTSGFLLWPVRADGSFGEVRVVDTGGDAHLIYGAIWAGEELVAWGLRNGPWTGPTIVLASGDGVDWTVRARVPGRRATVVEDIVVAGDHLVAVGYEGRRFPLTPRAWTSDDAGRTWTVADIPGQDLAIHAVESGGPGLIARGIEGWDSTRRAVSWVSTDGSAWTRLPDDQDLPSVPGFSGGIPVAIGDRTCVAGWFTEDLPIGAAIYCH